MHDKTILSRVYQSPNRGVNGAEILGHWGGVRKAWSDNGQPRCVTTFVGDLTGRPASPRDPVATCSYSSPVPLSSASRFSVVSSDIPASAVCDDNSGRRFHSWAR